MSQTAAYKVSQPKSRTWQNSAPVVRLAVTKVPRTGGAIAPWLLGYAALLVAALVGVLALNTSMTETAYELSHAQAKIVNLQQRHETIRQANLINDSTSTIELRARQAGMVPASQVVMVNLAKKSFSAPIVEGRR